MNQDLAQRMELEPCILMTGKNDTHFSQDVMDYRWNMIVTTSCELKYSVAYKNEDRMVRDIFDAADMQANMLNRRNLHVIRLCGEKELEEDADEFEKEDYVEHAAKMLEKVTGIIRQGGILVIEDFQEDIISHQVMRRAFKNLYEGQKQVYFFRCPSPDKYVSDLIRRGIAQAFPESFNDYFQQNLLEEDWDYGEREGKSFRFYVDAGKKDRADAGNKDKADAGYRDKAAQKETIVEIGKSELLETESFAQLLHIDLMREVRIPNGMKTDYFYTFLKNSIRGPQWFGYEYGFNLHRAFEEDLYKKVKKGLENVGRQNNKPLLLTGQTGTGKSIAIGALARRIFWEKKYPVIFINDPEINFYADVQHRQKQTQRRDSSAFKALDNLLEILDNKGAKATLIIWDSASHCSERKKFYGLYQALLARGRKIYMVGTSYEMNREQPAGDVDVEDEDSLYKRKIVYCEAKKEITDEIEQLRKILTEECKMPEQEAEEILHKYSRGDSSFLVLLYQIFEVLRGGLSRGVSREAYSTLREIEAQRAGNAEDGVSNLFSYALGKVGKELEAAGLGGAIRSASELRREELQLASDDFIRCVAVCSLFKLKMPYDMALRILGTYHPEIIRVLARSAFFVISEDFHGNQEISIRTPLEAQMFLNAEKIGTGMQVGYIQTILGHLNPGGEYGQQKEVRLCENLVRIIGPNNVQYGNRYRNNYEEIIQKLRQLREEEGIWEPILVIQEIVYIREYYGRNRDTWRSDADRIEWLGRALDIADQILIKAEHTGMSVGTRNSIIVEAANSKLLLCELRDTRDPVLYRELRRDLREIIRYDNQPFHAYVTLLKGSRIEYEKEPEGIRKLELLETMCSAVDEIKLENPDIADSRYFQSQVTVIYGYLQDTMIVASYVDELADNGSAAGIYAMARQRLQNGDIDFRLGIQNKEQKEICQAVYELLCQDKYHMVVTYSEPCQYMLLNILWLMHNEKPIYQKGECWHTSISRDVWEELLAICTNYQDNFSNDSVGAYRVNKNIQYMRALCQAQVGQYTECLATLRDMEEDSTAGIGRVMTKHMICDETGNTVKFSGRIKSYDAAKREGQMAVDEFGKYALYFHGPHLHTSDFTEGRVFDDLEIGLCDVSVKVYRGTEG